MQHAPRQIVHDDDHCTGAVHGTAGSVTSKRPLACWAGASETEKQAFLQALEACSAALRRLHPEATIRVSWNEPPVSHAEHDPLHIAVRAVTLADAHPPHDNALIRGESDPLLDHLAACFPHASRVDIAVAFVLEKGVQLLRPYLADHLRRGRRLRLLTGDYFDVTEPNALASLLDLTGNLELRVFETRGKSFHPKSYIFHFEQGAGIAFVGSSNLSETALGNGVEWNYRVLRSRDDDGFDSVCEGFERLLAYPETRTLDHGWIERYRQRRRQTPAERTGVPSETEPPPDPHDIQRRALAALAETRKQGNVAGLVVLATGLGKTWLAAFDSVSFERVLFVAHREEILDQALATFRRIRPAARLGRFTGSEKSPDADVLFASIQTLGREQHLQNFAPDGFDYIVVDEFHHATAPTYRTLLEHFQPRFLLGLTATPERSDGADLLRLCGNNLVFRCGLAEGVREGLLSPFRYYGVPDDVDYAQIPWRSRRFDEEELTRQLATRRRAENALKQYREHAGSRTLAFCASQAHADFMADHFAQNGVPSVAVHSGESSAPRANSLDDLRRGRVKVVFSVDMLGEGVDVPDVDTVMMLRPTESRVLWLQQLGRGLRRTDTKERLQVIDYIGNHRCFLEKARALLSTVGLDAENHHDLRAALAKLRNGDLQLPEGCAVTYDLEAIEILDRLLAPVRAEDRLCVAYDEFRGRNGRRPTAAEMFSTGELDRKALERSGSWFEFVDARGDLTPEQQQVLAAHNRLLRELEASKMERSYKMLALQAMLELDVFPGSCEVDALAERLKVIADRSPALRMELAATLTGNSTLTTMVRQNPLRAWAGTKRGGGSLLFELDASTFRTRFDTPAHLRKDLQEMVRELIEWRLADYLDRRGNPDGTDRLVMRGTDGNPIDAQFTLRWAGRQLEVLWHSRGGTKGSKSARNVDYSRGLDLLLTRAQ